MAWTVNSEIFPLHARTACVAFTTAINWFSNILVTSTFLTLTEVAGRAGAFWVYMGFAVTGYILLLLLLPETKGKSLEETATLFNKKSCIVFRHK